MELTAMAKKRKPKEKAPCNNCGRMTKETICLKCKCKHGRLEMLCDECSRQKAEAKR